jgi:hypothetical protein
MYVCMYVYTHAHTNTNRHVFSCRSGRPDVPLPVGMRGSVTLFDFVPCEWEISRALIKEELAENVLKSREYPVFSLWPVGRDFSWFKGDAYKQRFPTPKAALLHLENKIRERFVLCMYECMCTCNGWHG